LRAKSQAFFGEKKFLSRPAAVYGMMKALVFDDAPGSSLIELMRNRLRRCRA
jgi:hypothetical protein